MKTKPVVPILKDLNPAKTVNDDYQPDDDTDKDY